MQCMVVSATLGRTPILASYRLHGRMCIAVDCANYLIMSINSRSILTNKLKIALCMKANLVLDFVRKKALKLAHIKLKRTCISLIKPVFMQRYSCSLGSSQQLPNGIYTKTWWMITSSFTSQLETHFKHFSCKWSVYNHVDVLLPTHVTYSLDQLIMQVQFLSQFNGGTIYQKTLSYVI